MNQAKNSCPECGAYRIDGLPPRIHERGCPNYEDGLTESILACQQPPLEAATSALLRIRDRTTSHVEAIADAARTLETMHEMQQQDRLDLEEPVPSTEPGYRGDEA